jgi:hypothetical protein
MDREPHGNAAALDNPVQLHLTTVDLAGGIMCRAWTDCVKMTCRADLNLKLSKTAHERDLYVIMCVAAACIVNCTLLGRERGRLAPAGSSGPEQESCVLYCARVIQ